MFGRCNSLSRGGRSEREGAIEGSVLTSLIRSMMAGCCYWSVLFYNGKSQEYTNKEAGAKNCLLAGRKQ